MGDKTDNGAFDIKFTTLPPDLQLKLWILALDANTSKVNLAYKNGAFVSSFAYNYGGSVEASLSVRRFSTKLGVNPSNGNVDLGLVYRGFNFGASTSLTRPTVGLGLSYGASSLPFPNELSTTFYLAERGLMSMTRDIRSAPNNPLGWYNLHSNDATAIGHAINAGQQISKYGKDSKRYGFGLHLNYLPQTGLTIYGSAVFIF